MEKLDSLSSKKIITISVVVIIILSIYIVSACVFNWFPCNIKKIDYYPAPPEKFTSEDLNFTKKIANDLSNVIFTAYNETKGEIAKGRAFGTKGEWLAAEIINTTMFNLELYNPTSDSSYREQIENKSYPYKEKIYQNLNLTDKLEVISKKLTIYDTINNTSFECECFISPTWNKTDPGERNTLTHNFSYQGVKLISYEKQSDDFFTYAFDELEKNWNWSLNDSVSLEQFAKNLLEEYYNFIFTDINPDDPLTWPIFVEPINITENDKYVLFEVNKGFNPDFNDPDENNRSLRPLWGLLKKSIEDFFDIANNDCYDNRIVGKIQYDYDPNCHDTRTNIGKPIPVILINRTDGNKIKNIINSCMVDFYVNQSFNTSVISYNVIGQINGTNQNKTVIISSLYDSMWCQGTVDSAIGVGIVLTIAKYFKDHNITPKYNLKFIAFGGEEYGMLGAKYYEKAHRNESIPLLIDINQVGYSQSDPKQTMHVITNKLLGFKGITEIVKRSEYEKRTTDRSTIDIMWCPFGSRSNDLAFASAFLWRSDCRTVMFVKDFGWTLHHRDGRKNGTDPSHTAGDTMDLYNDTEVALTAEMVLNMTYGLMFKELRSKWDEPGFIPFIITIIVIMITVIMLWKNKYFIDLSKKK